MSVKEKREGMMQHYCTGVYVCVLMLVLVLCSFVSCSDDVGVGMFVSVFVRSCCE